MNRCCCGWTGLSAWLLVIMTHLLPAASPDARPVFKAGFAQRDISPAVGWTALSQKTQNLRRLGKAS